MFVCRFHLFAYVALLCLKATLIPCANAKLAEDPSQRPEVVSSSTLTGQVVDTDGKGVQNADVYLLRSPNGAYTLPVRPLSSKTASDGGFIFDQLPEGSYQIWAETTEATSLVKKLRGRKVKIVAALPEQENAEVEKAVNENELLKIPLHPGCGFDVSVHDSNGQPVVGADISFGWTDIDRHYATQANGVARIRGLAEDEWYLVVRAPGMAIDWLKTSKQNLGSVLPLDFTLSSGGSLKLKLVDETGSPVQDAEVYVSLASRSTTPNLTKPQTRTDAEGVVLCESLPLDKPLRIYAVKDGFDSVNSELTVPPGEAPQVTELLMKRTPYGGDVLVRVVDMDGKPIEGAELFNQGNSSRNLRTAKTNADGEALIQNVFKSFTGVVIVAKAADYVAQEIPATPGPIDLPGTVKITMRRGNTLRGQVVDPAGKPMPKLLVYFDRGENGDLKGGRVTTDGNGRFEISGLGAKAMLTVYAPQEYAPIQHMVVSTELNEEVELKLEPTGLLRIRAIDEESKQAIPAFNVRVGFCEQRQAGDLSPRSLISSLMVDGVNIQGDVREYRLGNQAPGTAFKVIVSAKGYQSITIPRMISVSSEQAECVDVALAKEDMRDYQVVAGRILDANGKPIVGAVVRLVNGSVVPTPQVAGLPPTEVGWKSYSWDSLKRDDIESRDQCKQLLKTVSDKEGCFRFEKVLQFTPWLELYYTGDRLLPQRFSNLRDKEAAELQELELVAERPCQLKVKVDKDKFPQAVKIRLAAADGGVNSIKLAYSYEYQELAEMNAFSNLPSGTYNVSLMAKTIPLGGGAFTNETLTTEPITLEPGSELEVAFE